MAKFCVFCNNELSGKQKKFCSGNCMSRQWKKDNKQQVDQYNAKYRELNPGYSQKWVEQNRDRNRSVRKSWNNNNPEYLANWKKNNKDKVAQYYHKRRSVVKGCSEHFTVEDVQKLFAEQKGLCVYCKVDISSGYHIDHIIPLVKGGSNDRNNISLSCGPCNLKKGMKSVEDFVKSNGHTKAQILQELNSE